MPTSQDLKSGDFFPSPQYKPKHTQVNPVPINHKWVWLRTLYIVLNEVQTIKGCFATLTMTRKLGSINSCKDFWDCYWGQGK